MNSGGKWELGDNPDLETESELSRTGQSATEPQVRQESGNSRQFSSSETEGWSYRGRDDAKVRGKLGQSISGKQSWNESWRVGVKVKIIWQRAPGEKLHIYWLNW